MQSTPKSYDTRIHEFERLVDRYLGFLSEKHGFARRETRAHDLNSPMDAGVSISFEREDLRVSIDLGLAGASGLGLMIRDNQWHTRPAPEDGSRPVKVVYFESLVEYMTDGAESPLVPHHGQAPAREVRAAVRRVEEDLASVVEQLAAKLAKHAPQVLHPDITTRFAAAADHYERR